MEGQITCPVFLIKSSFSQLCEGHCLLCFFPEVGLWAASRCFALQAVLLNQSSYVESHWTPETPVLTLWMPRPPEMSKHIAVLINSLWTYGCPLADILACMFAQMHLWTSSSWSCISMGSASSAKGQNQIKENLNLQMGSLQKQIEVLFRTTIFSCPHGSLLPKQWENEIYSLALWITCPSPLFSEGAGLSKQGRLVRWRCPTGSMASVCGASAPPLRGHVPGVRGSLVTLWAQVVSGYMFTHKHTFMLKVFHISFCFLVFFFL